MAYLPSHTKSQALANRVAMIDQRQAEQHIAGGYLLDDQYISGGSLGRTLKRVGKAAFRVAKEKGVLSSALSQAGHPELGQAAAAYGYGHPHHDMQHPGHHTAMFYENHPGYLQHKAHTAKFYKTHPGYFGAAQSGGAMSGGTKSQWTAFIHKNYDNYYIQIATAYPHLTGIEHRKLTMEALGDAFRNKHGLVHRPIPAQQMEGGYLLDDQYLSGGRKKRGGAMSGGTTNAWTQFLHNNLSQIHARVAAQHPRLAGRALNKMALDEASRIFHSG